MRIVIAGGTGFLGRPLTDALAGDGHDLVVLTRARAPAPASGASRVRLLPWTPNGQSGPWGDAVDGAGAVINLAGEPIAGRRWSKAQKQRLLDSRVQATRSLAVTIRAAASPPPVFLSASGVGYYGPLGDDIATEETKPGTDFLARLCVEWEAEASRAASARTRVVCVRTGLAIEKDGGALKEMLLPFRLGAGGPLGSGRQYWPWIHRQDWIDLTRWALQTSSASGALNATAPSPVTNAAFARALGRALNRPVFVPAPGFALRLLLGEMAGPLLLSGQRAVPANAERLGFRFRYTDLDDALQAIFRT